MLLVDAITERYRAPFLQRLPAWALPAAVVVVVVLLVAAALLVATERHHRRAAEQAVCAAKLETHFVRNPGFRAGRVQRADACTEWRRVAP